MISTKTIIFIVNSLLPRCEVVNWLTISLFSMISFKNLAWIVVLWRRQPWNGQVKLDWLIKVEYSRKIVNFSMNRLSFNISKWWWSNIQIWKITKFFSTRELRISQWAMLALWKKWPSNENQFHFGRYVFLQWIASEKFNFQAICSSYSLFTNCITKWTFR